MVWKLPCAKEPFVEVSRNISVCVPPQEVCIQLAEVQKLKLLKPSVQLELRTVPQVTHPEAQHRPCKRQISIPSS